MSKDFLPEGIGWTRNTQSGILTLVVLKGLLTCRVVPCEGGFSVRVNARELPVRRSTEMQAMELAEDSAFRALRALAKAMGKEIR